MASPTSVEIYNLGGVTLHVVNFSTISGSAAADYYGSSMPAIVGYWFNPTDTPTTASLNAVDVSLTSSSTGLFRFFAKEQSRQGKLYVLSLS